MGVPAGTSEPRPEAEPPGASRMWGVELGCAAGGRGPGVQGTVAASVWDSRVPLGGGTGRAWPPPWCRGAVVPCCGPQAQAASREREGRSPACCWPAGLSATLCRAVAPARGPGQWRPQGSWEWEDKQETQALGLPRPPRPPPACGGPPRALSSQRPPGRVLAGHWARPGRWRRGSPLPRLCRLAFPEGVVVWRVGCLAGSGTRRP